MSTGNESRCDTDTVTTTEQSGGVVTVSASETIGHRHSTPAISSTDLNPSRHPSTPLPSQLNDLMRQSTAQFKPIHAQAVSGVHQAQTTVVG